MHDSSRCGAILIVIDGCRPDGIQQADTPNIDTLIAAYTFNARSVVPSATLPCHTSMFRGVAPSPHGITTNTWVPMVRPVPSIVEAAHAMNRQTAFVYNWEQLRDLAAPSSLERTLDDPEGDLTMAQIAAQHLAADRPDFCFGPVRIFDTAPTLAHALELPLSSDWEGQSVMQIFRETENRAARYGKGR